MPMVKPGQIKDRKPRPLTDAEKAKLRKRNGGHATADQLASLANAFARPEHKRDRDEVRSRETNGWTS